jgi:hypothetical protein
MLQWSPKSIFHCPIRHWVQPFLEYPEAEWATNIGCSKSPWGVRPSPPAGKIQAFGYNMINSNFCQMKYWHFVRDQFSGSFYQRQFRRDIDSRRISWTFGSRPWFAITCSIKNRTWRSRRNSASDIVKMLSVSLQWIRRPLAFGAGEHRWKTTSDPEYPSVTVFQMQFRVFWIEILTLHVGKSPRICSF